MNGLRPDAWEEGGGGGGGGGEGVVGDVDHHLLQVFSHEQLRAGGVQYNA